MAKPARIAEEFIPVHASLTVLREAAKGCTACDLYKCGTQTVFGEGASHARVILVGEQPGDKEDLLGKPFVGPSGKILDTALEAAGIDRTETYVTNMVKHFKWEPRGKRRIHKKPNAMEIAACRPWFDAEVKVLKPRIVVVLGATAAQALLGRAFRVTKRRGEIIEASDGRVMLATVHPSAILRAPDDDARHEEMRKFIADLKVAAAYIHKQVRRAA